MTRKTVTRNVELRVKLSKEEDEFFKAEAERLGIPVAGWVRMILRKAARMIDPGPSDSGL